MAKLLYTIITTIILGGLLFVLIDEIQRTFRRETRENDNDRNM